MEPDGYQSTRPEYLCQHGGPELQCLLYLRASWCSMAAQTGSGRLNKFQVLVPGRDILHFQEFKVLGHMNGCPIHLTGARWLPKLEYPLFVQAFGV